VGTVPPFRELIAETTTSAIHLEIRDSYTPSDPQFLDWLAGRAVPEPALPDWHALVRAHVARGVRFRRARVVSEPLAPYIRFEYFMTEATNVDAGEDVRWLPRRIASDLCLPANDFWLFDDRLIRFHHFSGEGEIVEGELCTDPGVIRMCAAAFELIWERAIPHALYRPA
jgi:hypothetical protein